MLEELRQKLDDLDNQLLELAAERQRVVAEIGRYKRANQAATRDFNREREVLLAGRDKAAALGLSPDLAEDLLSSLIRSSLTKQEADRVAHGAQGQDKRVLIIGGAGKIGNWFAHFLSSQGFAVDVADPSPSPGGFNEVSNWQDTELDYDIIIVATTMEVSKAVLETLRQRRPQALIFDVASLKSPLRQSLRSLADAGLKVTSLHPMFGPDVKLLSGQHVVFVDLGNPQATDEAKALFSQTMATQVDMSLEDHDRVIAYVLGLSHVLNIAFFTALRESGEAAQTLAHISSTTFNAQLNVSSKVAAENPYMYFEIQRLNDYRLAALNGLVDAVSRIKQMIESGDEAGFVSLMTKGNDYLSARPSQQ